MNTLHSVTGTQTLNRFDCDRSKLDQALLASGSSDFWICDAATESVLSASWAKHQADFQQRGTGPGSPRVLEFATPCAAIQIPMNLGMGLVTPWSPPGSGKTGGFLASFVRNKVTDTPFPFPAVLSRNTDLTLGARCVFPSAALAIAAAYLHGQDGTKGDLKVGDGLFWSVGAVSCQSL
jgi:hypothetical protein